MYLYLLGLLIKEAKRFSQPEDCGVRTSRANGSDLNMLLKHFTGGESIRKRKYTGGNSLDLNY